MDIQPDTHTLRDAALPNDCRSLFTAAAEARRCVREQYYNFTLVLEQRLLILPLFFPRPNGFNFTCYRYGDVNRLTMGNIEGLENHSQTYVLTAGYKGAEHVSSILIVQHDMGCTLQNGAADHRFHTISINDLAQTSVIEGAYDDPLKAIDEAGSKLQRYYMNFITHKTPNAMYRPVEIADFVYKTLQQDPALLEGGPAYLTRIGESGQSWVRRILFGRKP